MRRRTLEDGRLQKTAAQPVNTGGEQVSHPSPRRIFLPGHRPLGPAARWSYPLVTYVTDGIESAMAQAKAKPP